MKRTTLTRFGVFALVVAATLAAISYQDSLGIGALERWVQQFGAAGPLVFMSVYALATVLFLPGSVLTLAGGALFGPLWGTLYNLTGATAGAAVAFLIARYLASDWVHRRAGGRTKQLIDGVEKEGWRFVAFVRLVPLFPFNLLNYALGLTRIPLRKYAAASYVFMLPGALAYTYLGYAGREAIGGGEGMIRKGLLALALLAAAAFLPRLVRHLRARTQRLSAGALTRRIAAGEDLTVLDVRSAKDYAGELGHVAGSLNIPLDELPGRLAELEPRRDRPLAVMCRTNRMSRQAVALLRNAGFKQALLVDDGMLGWRKAEHRVATESGSCATSSS